MVNNNYVVIMAGGIGSRFWPLSRSKFPKQFIDILGTGKTLLQQTYERFSDMYPKENIYIISNESYRDIIKEQISGICDNCILGEPVMRNTAACIAYTSYKIVTKNPNAVITVSPSDHLILNDEAFAEAIKESMRLASERDFLITLGIVPNSPNTGYGYIQHKGESVKNNFYKVKTFTEKPGPELARTFLNSGDFLWNSGVFIWNVKSILKAFFKYLPDIDELFREGIPYYFDMEKEKTFIESAYARCKNVSIDYGIMEHADNVYTRPSNFGWSDLGTWSALYSVMEGDAYGNVILGNKTAVLPDSNNCIISSSSGRLLALQGLKDYIIVDDKDVLMICKKEDEQKIKQMVALVKGDFGNKYI